MTGSVGSSRSSRAVLIPASFFEKKQAIDNATKVADFGPLYWAHLRLGRLNGPKFYCVRGGFRRSSVHSAPACCKFHLRTATPHGRVEPGSPLICNSQTGHYMATFSGRISPFFPEFRHFLVSARGKLGLRYAACVPSRSNCAFSCWISTSSTVGIGPMQPLSMWRISASVKAWLPSRNFFCVFS